MPKYPELLFNVHTGIFPRFSAQFLGFSQWVQPSAVTPSLKSSVFVGEKRGGRWLGKGLEGSGLLHFVLYSSPLGRPMPTPLLPLIFASSAPSPLPPHPADSREGKLSPPEAQLASFPVSSFAVSSLEFPPLWF